MRTEGRPRGPQKSRGVNACTRVRADSNTEQRNGGETAAGPVSGGTLRLPAAWACQVLGAALERKLRVFDLAVCFAALEGIEGAKKPVLTLEHLVRTLGGGGGQGASERAVASSLRRLQRKGVLRVEPAGPRSASYRIAKAPLDDLENTERGEEMYRRLDSSRRRCFVVGRRALRWALRCGTKGLLSRLGVLVGLSHRCLFLQADGSFTARGRSKARELAAWLGVSKRTVDARRREFELAGLIRKLPVPVWNLKRWGENYEFNLRWGDTPESPPQVATQKAQEGAQVATLDTNQSPSPTERGKNQSPPPPAAGGGSYRTTSGKRFPRLGPWNLGSFEARMGLFDELARLGWVRDTALQRAELEGSYRNALAQGRDPAAVLAWRVQNGKLSYCTDGAEAGVYERIKRYLNPVLRPLKRTTTQVVQRAKLTQDGLVVRRLMDLIGQGRLEALPGQIPGLLVKQGWSLERARGALASFELWSGRQVAAGLGG